MKKRLLITSIVMMLVVAVALSTATYAWFTSNASVRADAVVLTASVMDGDAILITHNANGTDASNAITLTAVSGSHLYPATPKAATSLTTFTENNIANIGANFQNLIMGETGTYTDPGIASPNVSYYKDTFYVFNKGFQTTKLTPTVTIYYDSGDNTSAMAAQSARIAIIERIASAQTTIGEAVSYSATGYTLRGIWEFDTDATASTYVHPAAYKEGVSYYEKQVSGNTTNYIPWTGATITSENFAANQANLYIAYNKSTAKIGANGSSTEASGYGVVGSGTYTQGNVLFVPDTTFGAIGVATSGNHIANEYTVIVWLEGWDADCTNAITNGSFRVDLSFAAGRVS